MGLFPSRPELPSAVRSSVRGRALASAASVGGVWLVGTRETLVAVDAEGETTMELRWEQVQRADWDADDSTLRVEQVEDYGRPLSAYSFVLAEPGALLELVRERVTASVVLQRRTEVARRRGFTVIGRRAPTGGGEVTWAYEFDTGVDPDDPAVMVRAEAALIEAKESLGL